MATRSTTRPPPPTAAAGSPTSTRCSYPEHQTHRSTRPRSRRPGNLRRHPRTMGATRLGNPFYGLPGRRRAPPSGRPGQRRPFSRPTVPRSANEGMACRDALALRISRFTDRPGLLRPSHEQGSPPAHPAHRLRRASDCPGPRAMAEKCSRPRRAGLLLPQPRRRGRQLRQYANNATTSPPASRVVAKRGYVDEMGLKGQA